MDHDEVDCNNYKDKEDEWFPYVKQDVLYTIFGYARYSKAKEEITEFGIKDFYHYQGWDGIFSIVLERKRMN